MFVDSRDEPPGMDELDDVWPDAEVTLGKMTLTGPDALNFLERLYPTQVRTIRKGDCVLQKPMIPHREIECSEDFAVLEIVNPAGFETKELDGEE